MKISEQQTSLFLRLCAASALSFASLTAVATPVFAQQVNVAPESTTVEGRTAMAISYPEGPTLSVKFKGTPRLPKSSGEAKIQRKRGATEIEIEVDEIKPATSFGGDYATYVLWAVTPEGQVHNLGEFVLRGNRSKLNVSTPQQTFALFITAEPHFMVSSPSRFVVMESVRPTQNITGQMIKDSTIRYRGYEGTYNFRRETLVGQDEAKGEVRSDVKQAMVAVKLAERAGAKEFAPEELAKAQTALNKTLEADEANIDARQLMVLGHEAVRLAVEAEKLAIDRSFRAALDGERRQRAAEIDSLKVSIERAQSAAERARLEEQRRTLELNMERNARQNAQAKADDAARVAAEEMRRRELAEQQAQFFEQEKLKAQQQAAAATQALTAVEQQAQQLAEQKRLAEAQVIEQKRIAEQRAAELEQLRNAGNNNQAQTEEQKRQAEQKLAELTQARLAAETQMKQAEEQARQAEAQAKAMAEQRIQAEKRLAEVRANAEREATELAKARAEEAQRREAAEREAERLALEKRNAQQQAEALDKARAEAAKAADLARTDAERTRVERDEAKQRLQSALNTIVETRTTVRGIIVNLPDILFAVNRATLKPQARETLSKMCGIMQVSGDYTLSIEGHTDSVGTETHNQALSERRAKAVYDYLSSCGMQASRLSSKGLGETNPLESNDTLKGRRRNRRVEIVIADQNAAVPQTNQ